MDNTNKQRVINAIWENPARAFGCEFRQSGRYWENLRGSEYEKTGKIRLAMTPTQANIMVFYNGSSRAEKCDVFEYLADYVLHTAGFKDTLTRCAELYNLTLEFSAEERQQMNRAALAREVCASLIETLRINPTGEAARYITEVRGLVPDGVHFGELSRQALKRVTESLQAKNYAYNADDLRALGLTEQHATQGYNVVIPYYRNGVIRGLVLRNTREGFTGPKYLYSEGLGRGGYCDALTIGEPAVFVEGQMDAIRLMQSGIKNVVAMGGKKISEEIAKLLKARNITQITYVPDLEHDERGVKKTEIINEALAAFLSAQVDGETVVNNLYVSEFTAPEGADLCKLKIDADTFGKMNGNDALAVAVVNNAVPSWKWELTDLMKRAEAKNQADGMINISWFQSEFDKVYNRCGNFYERQRIKQYVQEKDVKGLYAAFGVTVEALDDKDEWNRSRDYNNRVKARAAELAEAIEKGVNPATIGEIVGKLAELQSSNTREEWEEQLNQSFDDELRAIADQPETLKTRWELGNITPNGYVKYENIEYWPADLSVYCAPTSHGKTMFLMQSAIDTVQATDKTILYVSCEENKRQLLERALNVYLDIPTTDTGKDYKGDYCFIRGTRKRAIKAALRDADCCTGYDAFMNVSPHFRALKRRITDEVKKYGAIIRPRLKFIHTDGSAESIAANVRHYVEQYRSEGVEVGAVFVDYMQLLTSENKNFSRTDELKDVCIALKACAERLELPLILAAQLNRSAIAEGIDTVTVANIGEGADIERIAHDLYLVWQIDKTKRDKYFTWGAEKRRGDDGKKHETGRIVELWQFNEGGDRSNRIFTRQDELRPYNEDGTNSRDLKRGYMYVEQIKARDGKTDGWGLFPFDGERGRIGEIDKEKMAE